MIACVPTLGAVVVFVCALVLGMLIRGRRAMRRLAFLLGVQAFKAAGIGVAVLLRPRR